MGDNRKMQGAFKGVNNFCKTCKKECKQFENVHVIYCPMRQPINSKIKVADPITSVLDESGFIEAKTQERS